MRLEYVYGDQLAWRLVVINLTDSDPEEAARLAEGAPTLQRLYGMPIVPVPRGRPISTEPAARALVAARLFSPGSELRLYRRLAVLWHGGVGLLDEPDLIARAALGAGLDPGTLAEWLVSDRVTAALAEDMRHARSPSEAAWRLEHKLGGRVGGRRYSAGSYEYASEHGTFSLPGFNPIEAHEAVIANLAPGSERRPFPAAAREVLEWADGPLATAELALITRTDQQVLRAELASYARCLPLGAELVWSLEPFDSTFAPTPAALIEAVGAVGGASAA